ncbi:MAG: alpha/beta hydrolase [Jatrophihabitans sp.]|uniref:alpha/beta hydrolase n=1 Tax=Jatrophihabitans sp. TaxID=1932789 RepID=UPI00391273BE
MAAVVATGVLLAACSSSPAASGVQRSTAAAGEPIGRVVVRAIAGVSGFHARPAYVYLPPAYLDHPSRPLPALEILHGTPGAPSDWAIRGQLLAAADSFAAGHGGRAPIIVMPDINGSWRADSECIRTAAGADVEAYLTSDVVTYVRTAFRAAVGRTRWWLAGVSEGGLCAAMLALRHPTTYSDFGDMSGLSRPRVEGASVAASVRQLFGTDLKAQREHDVIWLLQHHRYPTLRGWFECGASDTEVRRDQAAIVAAAAPAGLPTHASVHPGKHGWTIWRGSLRRLLPWLWERAPS